VPPTLPPVSYAHGPPTPIGTWSTVNAVGMCIVSEAGLEAGRSGSTWTEGVDL